MKRGLTIGKFLPFHLGHQHLIATAENACDEVVVVVCDAGWHEISVEQRVDWISESFPGITVRTLNQDLLGLSDDDSAGWAEAVRALGPDCLPEVVFTSEPYGTTFAELLGAAHVSVDPGRITFPVSGSEVRAKSAGWLTDLPAQVRASLVPRICVIGAESTGKTTLAAGLAGELGATLVPEFGRFYTEAMPVPTRHTWTSADFETIALVQASFEDEAARWADPALVCDTNPYVTSVFREIYMGAVDAELERSAAEREYALFLLTDLGTPFEQDATGLRHQGAARSRMHERFLEYLERSGASYELMSGDPTTRLRRATALARELL